MSMTLYFAKMNINSHIYEVYENKDSISKIFDKVYSDLSEVVTYEKEKLFGKDGEQYLQINTYKFQDLDKMIGNENDRIIYGTILKESYKYLKQGISEDGSFVVNKIPFLEKNMFCFDVKNEIIVFNRTVNFGYKEFIDVFEKLLNRCVNQTESEDQFWFDISLLNKGIKIEELKTELKKLGAVEQLQISIIPPNPNSELLNEMSEQGQFLQKMKNGNVSLYVVNLESKGSSGVDLDSPVVNDELNKVSQIHKKLSEEQVTSKGYLKVRGRTRKGESFSSQDSRPLTREVSDDHRDKTTFIRKGLEYIMSILW